jgi:ubiquinone/menaquinone biosynthesis C-methylase UbiE
LPKPDVSLPHRYDKIMEAYDPEGIETDVLLKHAGLKKDAIVLEVGTGNGRVVFKIAPHAGEVYSIDVDEEILKVAEAELEKSGHKNVHLTCGDIQGTSFEDGFFDVVLCPWVLHHVEDKDAAMREVCRILKPGGVFLSIDVTGDNDYIQLKGVVKPKAPEFVAKRTEDVTRAIKGSGLAIIASKSLNTYYMLPTMDEVHMFFKEFDIPYQELDGDYLTRFLEERKTDGGYKISESAQLTVARKE